jgi:DHA1 family bicyclomycin/chloramphenicol resistance-like MFS transporter
VLSGRIAGRLSPSRQIFAGLLLSGAMAAGSLLLNLAWGAPPRLLQQLGMFGTSLGVQLVFPPLTLQVLDLYPAWRGSVASVQSFVQLSIGSAVMGVVAPAVDGSMAGIVGVSAAAIAAALGLAALARRNGTLAP